MVLASSGVDIIAPSDMMDGRVKYIREILDKNGFEKIPVFPYSIKYSSSFYGPFREAVNSDFTGGKRETHQMNFKNSFEFIREIEQDLNEGADAVIIKPALSYLDIISKVKSKFNVPIIASGGMGCLQDFEDVCKIGEADAVAVGTMLHYRNISISEIKQFASKNHINTRRWKKLLY